jgi:uncharacterized small protein (DUF1192 family)
VADNGLTHIYGVAGLIPGLLGLGLSWGVPSPWSEYALMASGWLAAVIYAILIWKIVRKNAAYAEECGEAKNTSSNLKDEIARLTAQHAKEMEQRASAMEFLAGIAMGQQPIPRTQPAGDDDGHQ